MNVADFYLFIIYVFIYLFYYFHDKISLSFVELVKKQQLM